MDWLINAVYYIVPFVVLLGILVFVHELGHYLVAKVIGVKVDEFSIGFGKKLWGFTDKSGTEWKVCAVPLGGYCKFFGDADASSSTSEDQAQISEEEKKYAFNYQPPFKKLLIALAGPGANYLFALLVFASIFYFVGKVDFPPVVGEIIPGGAAEAAGIKAGDRFLTVNGHKVTNFEDIRREVRLSADGKAEVRLRRGEKELSLLINLKTIPGEVEPRAEENTPMLGVRSVSIVEIQRSDVSLWQALKDAGVETWKVTDLTLRGVGQMITGKRGADDVGGIVRIAEMSGDISKQSGWLDFLIFMALLSINLGLINLFPIPVLDGGHVVISVVEMLTGRELNAKFKEAMFKFGLFLILSLMVFATYNDFARLFHRWFS